MSQQEIFNFLKKHPKKWFTAKEINEYLHLSQGSVSNNLKKLRLRNAVDYRKLEKKGFIYTFREDADIE
jgi:DNA-binding MarR family transcriptional regulator